MAQDERWEKRYDEVKNFIEVNHRNPSKYDDTERGQYVNWLRHNRKQYNAGLLKEERMTKFRELIELTEKYKRKKQYE